MRIDAHQHYWQLSRGDYGWLTPALGPIHRDFGPQDLAPLLARHGIARTILVQAAPTEAETAFLLDIAERNQSVAGVVGWCDFDALDASEQIARLSGNPLLVGLRPMVHDIRDENWLARPSLAPAFAAVAAHDLVFDALLRPQHIQPLLIVLDRHPTLAVVVDHAAKPNLVSGEIAKWREDIAAVGARPQTFCKISGLVTEASPGWTIETLRPIVSHLLAVFGPDRLIWGSDWPVVTLRADYSSWFETVAALLAPLPEADRAAIMGGNAQRLYLSTEDAIDMLKGIDPVLSADLLWILAAMGHGDDLAIVDANHPADTVASTTASGRLIRLPGLSMARATRAILSVLPIDDFEPGSLRRMEVVGKPDQIPPVQAEVQAEIDRAVGEPVPCLGIERFAFYAAAKASFAVVQVGDPRPYGCFLLRKGVIAGLPG